jgi:hypothetical protein
VDAANRRAFRLRACARCGGDAYVDLTDGAEWRCLQCGRPVPEEAGGAEANHHAEMPKAA